MQVPDSPPLYVFIGKETGFKNKMMYRMKEITVKMGNIIKEMREHMPKGFFRHHVFLPANMAVMTLYNGPAVQAVLLFTLRDMRHGKFFLKIGTKIQAAFVFRLLNNSSNFVTAEARRRRVDLYISASPRLCGSKQFSN